MSRPGGGGSRTSLDPGLAVFVAGALASGALASPLVAQVPGETAPRFAVEIEAGPVWQTRNEARVPNEDDATLFSLRDITGSGPWPAGRVTLGWRVRERKDVRLVLAPLSLMETGRSAGAIRFKAKVRDAVIALE